MSSAAVLTDDNVLKAIIKWFKKTPVAGSWGAKPDHWMLFEEYEDGCEYVRQWVRIDPAKTFFPGTITPEVMGGGVVQVVEEDCKITSIVWLENPIMDWCDKNDPFQWEAISEGPEIRTRFLTMRAVLKKLAFWYASDGVDDNEIGIKAGDWEQISAWSPAPGYKHREFIRSSVVEGSGVVCSTECPDGSMYFEWRALPVGRSMNSGKPKPETPKPSGWGEFA